MKYVNKFEVIVIGGGHAGVEAACAAARSGSNTLLLTHNLDTIGQMSCNPAIGGIGKGHLVKEIDALGGVMAKAIDKSGIQFRTLNARKGPAVRATRAQADRDLYRKAIQEIVFNQENLTVFQEGVDDINLEGESVKSVITQSGIEFHTQTIILTAGTFLAGKVHIGKDNYSGGRSSDRSSIALANKLREMPFRFGRLKTGTPPRIDARSVDFSVMGKQPGDIPTPVFSFTGDISEHPKQVSCHITYTNTQTHSIIADNINLSSMYSGNIEGIGPRYCPSIEDKIMRFADKDRHQIFVEPEGLNSIELYPNGISTSLPFDVQVNMVRSIKGFEKAHITRAGYAIEYDYFDPRDLKFSLESKFISGLFFAGQINGTTGYEEAGAQGLIAGINASRMVKGLDSWYPKRDEAYIGVLIDDLIIRGTNEPYRMFTSRAEYRLILREDNADQRLTPIAKELGLVDDNRWNRYRIKQEIINAESDRLKSTWINPKMLEADNIAKHTAKLNHEYSLYELLKRPEINYKLLMQLTNNKPVEDIQAAEQVQIQAKYHGYIQRQQDEINKQKNHSKILIPNDFEYSNIPGLSNEIVQKLSESRPDNIEQAYRISGITPAAISLIIIYIKKHKKGK